MIIARGYARSVAGSDRAPCLNRRPAIRAGLCATALMLGAALFLVACGQGDDGADAPDATNVEPREAIRGPSEPELGAPSTAPERATDTFAPQGDLDALAPVEETLFADARITPASDSGVSGHLRFRQESGFMHINGTLRGLQTGSHGLHVHVAGDCSAPDAASAKGHFAPDDDPHGSPRDVESDHHVGDLGNVTADESGVAQFEKTDAEMTLGPGDYTVLGRAVVVHAEPDNLASQPAGDAGDRVGCGVVELDVDPAFKPGEAESVEEQSGR